MKQRGFSLIELLIVVAIILVIAAIAIPNLLRAKIQANEASAISSIRAINTAQVAYASTYPTAGYADVLTKLGADTSGVVDANHAALLDWILGCASSTCSKSGYAFTILNVTKAGAQVTGYGVTGVPSSPGLSGIRGFCSDNMNPVRYNVDGTQTCTMDLQ
jgi:prepilin-type N-terminal cleavage/methylation domain-containing protein